MNTIMQNDNGTILELFIKDSGNIVDIRGATVEVVLKIKSERKVKIATIIDGENGLCQVELDSNDTSIPGVHSFQGVVKFPNQRTFSSDIHRFNIEKML